MNLIDKVFAAGIIGCGGAGFPTHVKLNTKVEYFLINAAECEPLLRTDRYLMINKARQIVEAAEAVRTHLCAKKCIVVLKSSYTEEIAALTKVLGDSYPSIEILKTDSFYPAGDEQVIVYEATGRVVPPAGIPLNVGCVVSNVATVYSIGNALLERPFIKKYLTVTGEVSRPSVLCVPVGTSLDECIIAAGGATIDDYSLILGGPMMGKVVSADAASKLSVTKTTSGIIVVPSAHKLARLPDIPLKSTLNRAKSACIQCSYCTQLCPRHMLGHPLEPHRIMRRLASGGDISEMTDDPVIRSAQLCSECGVCEIYACPMGLQPRKVNAAIKRELAAQGIKYSGDSCKYAPDENREYRKTPTRRLANRAGVGEYYHINVGNFAELKPTRVSIPLKQHIGAPSEPVVEVGGKVKVGQLIAACPEGKLGANYHASIDGEIVAVGAEIIIETR